MASAMTAASGEHGGGADDHPRLGQRRDRRRRRRRGRAAPAGPAMTTMAELTSPAAKVTAAITTALAASTRPRRGVAASVTRIRPRRYSAVMNIAPTTATAISPANTPIEGLRDGEAEPGRPGHRRRDVAGPGHGNRPPGRRNLRASRPRAARRGPDRRCRSTRPSAKRPVRLTWSKVPVASLAPLPLVPHRCLPVLRGGGEQAALHGRRQPGQGDGADLRPVRAVGRVVAGERVGGPGEPQPAR